MPSFAEAVAQAKDALADYLTVTPGLRESDGVQVSSAMSEQLPKALMVVLGDVAIPQSTTGYAGRQGNPSVAGFVIVQQPEGGEDKIRATRTKAAQMMTAVEGAVQAITKDPAKVGFPAMIGTVALTTSGMVEAPSTWNSQAARRVDISFSISWTVQG